MKYTVIKPFRDISGFKMPGESIELDDTRAAKLRVMGLIGGRIEQAAKVEPDVEIAEFMAELQELADIYPESKVYDKKLNKAKKVK